MTNTSLNRATSLKKWFTIGIGVKRWFFALFVSVLCEALGLVFGTLHLLGVPGFADAPMRGWLLTIFFLAAGFVLFVLALIGFSTNILAPYRTQLPAPIIDVVYSHSRRNKGTKVVAVGGGTGLPAVLKGLKAFTSNITAIVTVADDGGSSGRLRRELGVLPPGDLRNNIAALSDDENLMTQLFQYRFQGGDIDGHSFGNLFISALSGVTGSLEKALVETERVLNIKGRVLPATLADVTLSAHIQLPNSRKPVIIHGESAIGSANGHIEEVYLVPRTVEAYHGSVQAILNADIVVIGPGSLYTSILPNLLIEGITSALRSTSALKVYICNIATQPSETIDYNVADHIIALEQHIGRGIFQIVLANNAYPVRNAGENTHYVLPAPPNHEVAQRYEIHYTDLVDTERPWRHDPQKLVKAILSLGVTEYA